MTSKIKILNTIFIISALTIQIITSQNVLAKNELADPAELFAQTFQSSFPEGEITNKTEVVWKEDQSAFFIAARKNASAQGKKSSSLVAAVFIRQNDKTFKAVDISDVESKNLGSLAMNPEKYFDSFSLGPVKWVERKDDLYAISVTTHAWRDGQRFVASETVVISPDGTPLWR